MKYKKMKKNILIIGMLFILIVWLFPTLVLTLKMKKNLSIKRIYSLADAIEVFNEEVLDNTYKINLECQNNILYTNELKIDYDFPDSDLKLIINDSEYDVRNKGVVSYQLMQEGKNSITVQVYDQEKKVNEISQDIYYIKPYEPQFAENISKYGIQVHYRNGTMEKYDMSKNQLFALGVKNIRADFFIDVMYKDNKINFTRYDAWVNDVISNNINIIAILGGYPDSDENKLIDSNIEINEFIKSFKIITEHYPKIKDYEIYNELNQVSDYKNAYLNQEDLQWYALLGKAIKADDELAKENIISNGTSTPDSNSTKWITSNDFYKYLFLNNGMNYYDSVAFHPYAWSEKVLNNKVIPQVKLSNDNGGFVKNNVTEYGSTIKNSTEVKQAENNVKYTVLLEKYCDLKILYNLWTTASNLNSLEQYGLLTNDYKPRLSYYAMKNFYQNTNGSEYIGSIPSVADGLEFHVYDKDGVPLIICWSSDNSKTIEIPYSGFTAYDLYGNEIENTDGKLSITSSPVYLKNADRSYFYRAISNTAVNAYDEFLTNYSDYLDFSDEMISIKNKVNQMKKYAAGLATNGEVTEAEALNKMKEHFAIGDMIIDAYKNGKLSCEYVKLSSMLDQLNTTAYAFEDLITITAKDVSNAKLEATESIMNSFDNVVSANSEVEMVYPNKIKAFAKDYYDTSSYINGLEEENPIKSGLIISKGLHAYYLAEWASSFADCYLQDYEVKIKYSTTDLTNEDVVATLETDAPIELEGSNQYTFTENGSFTFKYTLNGEEKEITAVVDWIDKDAPVISGIDEREDDMDQVTLNVTDANLDSISLKKDGQDVSFNNGDVLIEVGEYVVIATDLAGNKAERSFKIVDYIESNKTYYISLNGTGDGLSDENPMNVKDVNKTRFYSGDKILFKSGEKYSIDIDCIRKGSPDNRVVISNYGDGELPVINGSISLMSNVDISNLKFTNGAESCLVTNYDFCENVKIENCIFDEVHDTAIYLNRQVSNIEITNCIFKNCKSTAIVMKNDSTGFEADKVSINNNVFIDIAKSIEIGSESLDNAFLEIEISKNYFVGQTGSDAIININKIVPDKFEVYIYSNLFYGFDNSYKVIAEDENIKKFLVCDYNAFYRYSESNIFNDIKNIADLINRYDNENGSKVVFISKEKYEVEKCLESVSTLNSVDEIVEFLSKDVKEHEGEKQLRSYGRTDELIINKVLTADEMKKSNMKVMTDSTVADEKLPLAGWQKVSIAVISIIVVTGLFSAIKYAKFKKDTRKQIRRK